LLVRMLLAPAIYARGLRKSYEQVEAVRGVDLHVGQGEIVAFLGPNGAGKTTILEILEGHRRRDSGDVTVLGFDPGRSPRALRERIGIVPQETAVEPVLTVQETVELYAASYPRPRPVDEVIALVDLEQQRHARVSSLSGGQQRRLDLAVGIAGDPELLFLDEPTTGFDPSARRRSWELIRRLGSLGKTVLLTTHYMEEAQQLAERVVVIAAGQIVADSTPDALSSDGTAVISFRVSGERATYRTETPQETLLSMLLWAQRNNLRLEGLTVSQPTLEDVYLELTDGARE
jgi:ABC-2 type transport system ATP-binding protein